MFKVETYSEDRKKNYALLNKQLHALLAGEPNRTSAQKRETLRIEDVHAFPGHIACDAASQSEIVVPIIKNGEVFGVLDIDSPEKNRFDEIDQQGLEDFVETLVKHI